MRLHARPIHPSDLLTVRGLYGSLPSLPATPGVEGAGTIAAIGPGVPGWQIGQRVIPLATPGTWQQYLVVKASQLIPIPDTLSDAMAAQFVVNPLTAWVMTTEELHLQPGQWLLQTAAGSTLGQVVLQIAGLRGFKTINVVRHHAQVEALKALGANEVVCTADEDLVTRVMEITGRAGVPAAIDAVGGQTGADVARALASHGVMLVYGLLSGQPIPIDGGRMIFRGTTARGFWLSDWVRRVPFQKQREISAELLGLLASGKIAPPIEAEYPLHDVVPAVQYAERGGRQGKVLLVD